MYVSVLSLSLTHLSICCRGAPNSSPMMRQPRQRQRLLVLIFPVVVGAMAAASTCFAFAFVPRNHVSYSLACPNEPNNQQCPLKTHLMMSQQSPPTNSELDTIAKRRAILDIVEARSVQVGSSSKLRQYLYKTNLSTISLEQIQSVLSYLDTVLGSGQLTNEVLQSTPRIIRKSVHTQLKPTVEFLQSIYSEDLFLQAIGRNPSLLVTSGVGYDGSKKNAGGEDVENFLIELGVAESAVRRLKKSNPTIFQFSVEEQVRPVADYLVFLFATASAPDTDITQAQLAGARKSAGKVIKSCPTVLGLSVDSNLMPKVDFLKVRCGLDQKGVVKILDAYPELLGLSLAMNIQPTVDYISNVLLGSAAIMPDDAIEEDFAMWMEDAKVPLRKCISRHPQIVGLSIENLRSKVAYFDEIDSIVSVDAALAVMSKGGSKGQASFEECGHNGKVESLAARVLLAAPSTYSLSLENNIMPKVECLAGLWGTNIRADVDLKDTSTEKIRDENGCLIKPLLPKSNILSTSLCEYPPVLTLSMEANLLPTIDFYNRTGYVHLDNDGRAVPSQVHSEETSSRSDTSTIRARYLATSLFNRLLPRWHYYKAQRSGYDDTSLVDDPLCSIDRVGNEEANDDGSCQNRAKESRPPLHLLAGASDAQFCSKCNFDLTSYERYRQDEAGRLKFNWQFADWIKTGRPIDT